MVTEIALQNTSNITLATVPSGVAEPSVNSIALFTIEQPSESAEYTAHVMSSTVAELYGSNSLTAKMASAIFSQSMSLRSGDGTLYVVPYVGTSATSTTCTTADITANIDNFKTVSDGSLKIILDGGSAVTVTGLDFRQIQTLEDIAKVLNTANLDCFIEATATGIKFTSKRLGTESTISFDTAGSGTDIGGSSYLDTANSTLVQGVDSTSQETLADAVVRAKSLFSFGGVLTTQMLDNADIVANATPIQELDCLYLEATASTKNISILGNSLKAGGFTKTHAISYPNGLVEMKCCIAGALSRALSVNWNGVNTANTLNLKQLATIQPASYTQTDFENAKRYGVDLYGSTQGYSCYYSFDNGAFIDEIIMDLFLKTKLEVAGFNVLATVNTKISQTEKGMTFVKNALELILIQGQRNGYIAGGQWNSPANRFGDDEDFDANILQHGYYMYSLPVTQQAQTEREQRKAPLIQIAVKRSGAIHSVNGSVIIER